MSTPVGSTMPLLAAAATVFVATIVAVIWVGRQIRGTLGGGATRKPTLEGFDAVPPAVVKQALERGLVTSAQLATMSPLERHFVLTSVRKQLEGDAPADVAPPRTAAAATPTIPPPKAPMPQPPVPADGVLIPDRPRLKVWCPLCGEPLKLPAFPPMVAHCASCGAKTAVREDSGPGRYIINVSVPQGPEAPRG